MEVGKGWKVVMRTLKLYEAFNLLSGFTAYHNPCPLGLSLEQVEAVNTLVAFFRKLREQGSTLLDWEVSEKPGIEPPTGVPEHLLPTPAEIHGIGKEEA